jgi:hypothetical protein
MLYNLVILYAYSLILFYFRLLGNLPWFDGISLPDGTTHPSSVGQTPVIKRIFSEETIEKYSFKFMEFGPVNGLVTGNNVIGFLYTTGLDGLTLSKIW